MKLTDLNLNSASESFPGPHLPKCWSHFWDEQKSQEAETLKAVVADPVVFRRNLSLFLVQRRQCPMSLRCPFVSQV